MKETWSLFCITRAWEKGWGRRKGTGATKRPPNRIHNTPDLNLFRNFLPAACYIHHHEPSVALQCRKEQSTLRDTSKLLHRRLPVHHNTPNLNGNAPDLNNTLTPPTLTRIALCKILTLFILASCSSGPETSPLPLPLPPQKPISPSDTVLKSDLMTFFENSKAPQSTIYDFHRVDLNFDGRKDAIVLMRAPYGYWCDKYGCKMLILKARNNGFDIVNSIEPVREPVYVGKIGANNWRELALRVSGWWGIKTKNVILRFDGNQYPKNPTKLPAEKPDISSFKKIFDREGTRR